jgi:uncharacterized membrane protein
MPVRGPGRRAEVAAEPTESAARAFIRSPGQLTLEAAMASTHQFPSQTLAARDGVPGTYSVNMPGQELRWPASMIWRRGEPAVRTIGVDDLKDAVMRGISDFAAVPSHAIFLILLYPVIGVVLARILFGYDMMPLVYPLAAGFALVGPVAAIGLYELSKRREEGKDLSVWNLFDVFKSPSIGAIMRLGLVMFGLLIVWLYTAHAIYQSTMGVTTFGTVENFVNAVTQTPEGHSMMFAGNLVGFVFALLALVTSAISFPMLVDRNVSASTAVRTSVRAFAHNPVTMSLWGLFVAIALAVGTLPMFIGLALVLPILGHATWHLYRKVVSRDEVLTD